MGHSISRHEGGLTAKLPGLLTPGQPRSLRDQSQARQQVGHTTQPYSQSGELRRALEKQFWKDLQLVLIQTPEEEGKNERTSGGHDTGSGVFRHHSDQSTGIQGLSGLFNVGHSARASHIPSCGAGS